MLRKRIYRTLTILAFLLLLFFFFILRICGSCNKSTHHTDVTFKNNQYYLFYEDFEKLEDNWPIRWGHISPVISKYKKLPSFNISHQENNSFLKISSDNLNNLGELRLIAPYRLNVKSGKEYILSYKIKTKELNHKYNSINTLILLTQSKQKENGKIDYKDNNVLSHFTSFNEWTQIEKSFTVTSNYNLLSLKISCKYFTGTIFLDDISIREVKENVNSPQQTIMLSINNSKDASSMHYFTRDKPIKINAIIQNTDNESDINTDYTIRTEILKKNQLIYTKTVSSKLKPTERKKILLFNFDITNKAIGSYVVKSYLENNNTVLDYTEYPLDIIVLQKNDYPLLTRIHEDIDSNKHTEIIDELQSLNFSPLLSNNGTITSSFANKLLEKRMHFAARINPDNIFNEYLYSFINPLKISVNVDPTKNDTIRGFSDISKWEIYSNVVVKHALWNNQFPNFSKIIVTSDDYARKTSLDWNENNIDYFKREYNMDPPEKNSFRVAIEKPNINIINPNNNWKNWYTFTSKNIYGGFIRNTVNALLDKDPNFKLVPFHGYSQKTVLNLEDASLHPKYNYGNNEKEYGYNLLGYYLYPGYEYPSLGHIFYLELALAGNRDMWNENLITLDAFYPDDLYTINNFYLVLAAGAKGLNYFRKYEMSNEFKTVAKNIIGPTIKKYGSLFSKLEPTKKKIGFLVSFTNEIFADIHNNINTCNFTKHSQWTYANLLRAHLDIEPVLEEELLEENSRQYEAIILGGIEYLTSDVYNYLDTAAKTNTKIIVGNNTKIGVDNSFMHKINVNISEKNSVSTFKYKSLNDIDSLRNTILSKMDLSKYSDIEINKSGLSILNDKMIYRTFKSGDATYYWFVDVLNDEENYALKRELRSPKLKLTDGGSEIPNYIIKRREILTRLRNTLNLDSKTTSTIKIPINNDDVFIYDVLGSKKIMTKNKTASNISFDLETNRLHGKLIVVYPKEPTNIYFSGIDLFTNENETYHLKISICSSDEKVIKAAFPIHIEVINPCGVSHDYTRYVSTNSEGIYEMKFITGKYSEKGIWKIKIKELSTGCSMSKIFINK